MKAVVKTKKGYGCVEVLDYPDPTPPISDELIIQVKSSAICGTDLHTYEYVPSYHHMQLPVIMGHEFSGIVTEVGPSVIKFKPGDRVVGESVKACGACTNCHTGKTNFCDSVKMRGVTTDGAMCGYVKMDESAVHHIADNISFDNAAVAQPLAISVAGVLDNCRVMPGDDVVVIGPGIIGQTAAWLAKLQGAHRVIMVGTQADAATRLPMARELGFIPVNSQELPVEEAIKAITGKPTVDVAIECAGAAPSLASCIRVLKKEGWLSILGVFGEPIAVDLGMALRKGLNIRVTYSCTYQHYEKALQLLSTGQIDLTPLSTAYAYTDVQRAYEEALSKICLKPVLRFS